VSEHSKGKEGIRLTLEASAKPVGPGTFEVMAITAGEGNGWVFPAEVLQASLPLWEAAGQGVRATLRAFGPGGPVLTALGEAILAGEDLGAGRIGFSADVLFAGKNRRVEKILKVFSVDLVYDPARGGAFLRQLNQIMANDQNGGYQMNEQVKDPTAVTAGGANTENVMDRSLKTTNSTRRLRTPGRWSRS
jgi:hypothetical protein